MSIALTFTSRGGPECLWLRIFSSLCTSRCRDRLLRQQRKRDVGYGIVTGSRGRVTQLTPLLRHKAYGKSQATSILLRPSQRLRLPTAAVVVWSVGGKPYTTNVLRVKLRATRA